MFEKQCNTQASKTKTTRYGTLGAFRSDQGIETLRCSYEQRRYSKEQENIHSFVSSILKKELNQIRKSFMARAQGSVHARSM